MQGKGKVLVSFLLSVVGMLLFGKGASAGPKKDHPYRYSDIDIPVSLAVGTVRTPEFSVKNEAYFIMIQAEKRLPFRDMVCMMALASGPLEKKDCTRGPLLKADWAVWESGRIAAQGTSSDEGDDEYTNKYLFKFLGKFMGESGKKYVVEVKFTKDGAPLDVTNPHLIVILVKNH